MSFKQQLAYIMKSKAVYVKWKNEWDTHIDDKHTYYLINSVVASKNISESWKLTLLNQINYHTTKYAYMEKLFLLSLYQNTNSIKDKWKLNYVALKCVEGNPNVDLMNFLRNSIKTEIFFPSPFMLFFLCDFESKKCAMHPNFRENTIETITKHIDNCSFVINDLETFANLCLACRTMKLSFSPDLSHKIIEKIIVPYLKGIEETKHELYITMFARCIYPCYPHIMNSLIEQFSMEEKKKAYLQSLFNIDNKIDSSLLFFDWVDHKDLTQPDKINEVARTGLLENIVDGLIKKGDKKDEYKEILCESCLKYNKIIDIKNIINALEITKKCKDYSTIELILSNICILISRKWINLSIEDLLTIREYMVEIEQDKYDNTQIIEKIIRRFISCLTDIALQNWVGK